MTSAAQFRLIDLFLEITVYLPVPHLTRLHLQEPGSLFWCHAVLSLQFTHVGSFACKHRRSQVGHRGHVNQECSEHIIICALWGGITKKIVLFASNQTFCPPPNFWHSKFLGWLRYCLQGQVAKLASGLFYCWSLSYNNNMATNLQMFTSSYDIRRLVACDSWTQTSWQVM